MYGTVHVAAAVIVTTSRHVLGSGCQLRLCSSSTYVSCHQQLVDRWKYIANLLGVDEECSRRLVHKNDTLRRLDETRIEKTVDTLREIGMSVTHIVEHPQILSYYPGFIDARYWSLIDFGLEPVKIPEIIGYNSLIKKRSYELRKLKLLPDNVEPFDHLLSKLSDLDTRFVTKYPDVENKTLLYMKKLILIEFLSQKLSCPRSEVVALVKKYPMIANKSVCSIRRTLRVLRDRFGFTSERLGANGFLLATKSCNVNRIADVLTDTIGHRHLNEFVVKYSRVLTVSVSQLVANNQCLARHGITAKQILKCGSVYTLKTDTLNERLGELNSTDAFRALKSSPRVLSLVYSMNTAKQRLPRLDSLGFTSPSLTYLNASRPNFNHFVSSRLSRSSIRAGIVELASYLGRTERQITESLSEHPIRRGLSIGNISSVLRYLVQRGFTAEQILNGIQVVLYGVDVIETYVEAVPNMEECRSFSNNDDCCCWDRHPYALQLLLYVIEKNISNHHHHRQNGEKTAVHCVAMELLPEDNDLKEIGKKLPELKYGRRVVSVTDDEEVESFLVSKKDEAGS